MFLHFGICTFSTCDHNPGLPASLFNPAELDTDEWAATAIALGAKEMCITAHHEGGFALWPSNFTNYSVAAAPWRAGGGDVLAEFVESCHKFGLRPCFYMSPPANGHFHKEGYDPDRYFAAENGMLTELLTNYGPIHRLWWDHWCDGHYNATHYAGWIATARRLAPGTLLLPGPDGSLADVGETSPGVYPLWNSVHIPNGEPDFQCNPNPACPPCVKAPDGEFFRPVESDGTIQGCPLCRSHSWFWDFPNGPARILTAGELWGKYLNTVGRGANLIVNVPPDARGRIDAKMRVVADAFGHARNASLAVPVLQTSAVTLRCDGSAAASVVLNFSAPAAGPREFDALVSMEDLTRGQRVAAYTLDAYVVGQQTGTEWQALPAHGRTVGHRVIDLLPAPIPTVPIPDAVQAVRFTCLSAAPGAGGVAYLHSFAAHLMRPPCAP